jgi:hypothetical protein
MGGHDNPPTKSQEPQPGALQQGYFFEGLLAELEDVPSVFDSILFFTTSRR